MTSHSQPVNSDRYQLSTPHHYEQDDHTIAKRCDQMSTIDNTFTINLLLPIITDGFVGNSEYLQEAQLSLTDRASVAHYTGG